jgi:hypothetical protein
MIGPQRATFSPRRVVNVAIAQGGANRNFGAVATTPLS